MLLCGRWCGALELNAIHSEPIHVSIAVEAKRKPGFIAKIHNKRVVLKMVEIRVNRMEVEHKFPVLQSDLSIAVRRASVRSGVRG